MQLSLLLAKNIFSLLLIMLAGVVLVKLKVLSSEHGVVISKILLYIVSPCSILNAYEIDFTVSKLAGLSIAVGGAVLVQVIFSLIERGLRHPLHLRTVESVSLVYTNAGNLIIPLVAVSLGPEWVFYTSGYIIVQQVLFWTHCRSTMSGERGICWKNIVFNPNIIAIFLGIILFSTGFRLPGPLQSPIESVGGMLGPMSMLLLGMMLGALKLRDIFGNPRAYLIVVLRLILFPLIAVLIFTLCHLTGIHSEAKSVLLLTTMQASAPVASTVTQFAQLYNRDPGYSSTINILSVIFCVVTMPLMVWLYQALCDAL